MIKIKKIKKNRRHDRHKEKNRWTLKSLIVICRRVVAKESYVRVIAGAFIASDTDLMITYAYPQIKALVDVVLKAKDAAKDFSDAKKKIVSLIADVELIATMPNIYVKGFAILKAVYDLVGAGKSIIHGVEDIARERNVLIAFMRFYAELIEQCNQIRIELDIPAREMPKYGIDATASAWDDIIDGMKLLFDIYTGNTGLPPPNNPQLPPPPNNPQLPQLPDA